MRLFVEKIFEGFVRGTDVVYTAPTYNELLGSADYILLGATIDQIGGTNPSINIRSEMSNDQINWSGTTFISEVSGALVPGSSTYGLGGSGDHLAAYVRYFIQLADDVGSTPSAYVRLIACGRGSYPVETRVPLNPRP